MNKPATLDPLAHWRELVAQVEKGVNQFAGKAMASDGFAGGINRLTWGPLVAKKLSTDLANGIAQRMNVPTRADMLALGERLQTIEDHLVEMRFLIGQLKGAQGDGTATTAAQPRRTRKPPAANAAAAASDAQPVAGKRVSRARKATNQAAKKTVKRAAR